MLKILFPRKSKDRACFQCLLPLRFNWCIESVKSFGLYKSQQFYLKLLQNVDDMAQFPFLYVDRWYYAPFRLTFEQMRPVQSEVKHSTWMTLHAGFLPRLRLSGWDKDDGDLCLKKSITINVFALCVQRRCSNRLMGRCCSRTWDVEVAQWLRKNKSFTCTLHWKSALEVQISALHFRKILQSS